MIDEGRRTGDPRPRGGDRLSGRPVHVLVLNQHGDNRGDEAAFRAMFAGIEEQSPSPVRFTLLHQFAGGEARLEVPHRVRWISLVPSVTEAARMVLFALGLSIGLRWRGVLGGWGRSVVDACAEADVAVSAPGGPYFGDPYASHEPVHWFYVWLADRHGLPLVLYAPSVGPFEKRLRNPLRRWLFGKFRALAVREDVSLKHLERLLGGRGRTPVLTADSVLQRPIPALSRDDYFGRERSALAGRFLVGVSALSWTYPGHPDPAAAHAAYEEVMLAALVHLHERRTAHFLFVPQLYGAVHSDVPYLESLAARLPPEVSWEIVDSEADSDRQQAIFGMVDLYVASRYHPQIFAISHGVPGVCVYYQHKALGFLRQLGLERFAFPIDDLERERVLRSLDEILEARDALTAEIAEKLPALRRASARSTELVVESFPSPLEEGVGGRTETRDRGAGGEKGA